MTGDPAIDDVQARMVRLLVECEENGEHITLVIGSGLDDQHVPRVSDVIRLADRFADGRNDDGDLQLALRKAREDCADPSPAALYAQYRQVLAGFLSSDEFDAIAQQAVLQQYRPPDLYATALGRRGLWQPMTLRVGEELENDRESWRMPPSVRALGALLASHPDLFCQYVLTTNVDPLLEIAIRRAGGRAESRLLGDIEPAHADTTIVCHLHGFWRPLPLSPTVRLSDTLDDAVVQRIGVAASGVLDGDLVCVLGVGDRSGTVRAAIEAIPDPVPVIWVSHGLAAPPALDERIPVSHIFPVDNSRLLPALARRLGVAVPSEPTRNVQVRHPAWERLFVSQPDSEPPADPPGLLREMERRFAWRVEWAEPGPQDVQPAVVFWPVRLRRRTSVIHMVQAFAAGALATRRARVVVALEDLSISVAEEPRRSFEADLIRWIRYVAPEAHVRVQSLAAFVGTTTTAGSNTVELPNGEALLRPTDPWRVARDFYGRPVSLYTALAAVKALPHLAPYELDDQAGKIVQDLQRHNADRLLTPTTMWAYLHYLLRENPTSSLITLGGRDEGLFWEQWRQIYGFGISQLYNPRIKSLNHESGMVRWNSAEELANQLHRFRELDYWDDEGRYIHWLFQNAVLLPTYLTSRPLPSVGGYVIDSWAAFAAALDDGEPVFEMLAHRATELYQGVSAG
ncbi:hypothetical protein [Paractinoplanes toevensis]|uniref:SIR2-like domain-containing protein n=1 Tax=Paractinoplanes toevensis TaxID=571911 RepID=A0A919WCN5_9ACTN|nr:hypothetical protein [Actinoplanes toevensis]GIM97809.1 hypothetical protein Ato02nite_096020 [Actinoplanes toevensis]